MFNIANVFILPQHGEGSKLLQYVGGNITMLLHVQKRKKKIYLTHLNTHVHAYMAHACAH